MLKDKEADMKLGLFELSQVYTMGLFITLKLPTSNAIIIISNICCYYSEIGRSGTATCAVTMAESGLMEVIINAISSSTDKILIVFSYSYIFYEVSCILLLLLLLTICCWFLCRMLVFLCCGISAVR